MTDLELIARIRAGEEAAFLAFYRAQHESLWRFLYHLEHNEGEARDLFQETWLRATKLLLSATPIRNPRALLFQIAANCRRDHLRRKQVRRLFFLPEKKPEQKGEPFTQITAPQMQTDSAAFELEERLAKALRRLPQIQRQVFLLKEWEGFSLAEIAELLAIPVGTVKSRLHHAVRFLREELRELRE